MVARVPNYKVSRKEAEERHLVEAAQKDPVRFADLYERNFESVYAYITRRVGNRDETEELTSEVFHRALANLPRVEWRGVPFLVWLCRIAANAMADRAHRAARERQLSDLGDPPDAGLQEIEERVRLFRLVGKLPQDQRRVVGMRFADGKSIREIARELGRTEGAVKQLQFRALKNLRTRTGDQNA